MPQSSAPASSSGTSGAPPGRPSAAQGGPGAAGGKAPCHTASAWSRMLSVALGAGLLLGLYAGAGYYRLYGWLHEDRGGISHFDRMIVEDGKRLMPAGSERDRLIDDALLESQGLGRDVRALSRSEARSEPWWRYAFVKSTMETALPGAPHMTVPITFAMRFRVVQGSRVEVLGVDTLKLR